MTYDRRFASTWQLLLDAICTVIGLGGERPPPIILSSLPDLPYARDGREDRAPLSFIQGPPGRIVSLAVGLRAALPDTPLVLIMNADSVTLGTNHLIHAARRNIAMTLLLLRSDVTSSLDAGDGDRTGWALPDYQRELETAARPLDWVTALDAAFVGRATLRDPDGLAALVHDAVAARGFSVLGVIDDAKLPTGVLSRAPAPEYFDAYRRWSRSFMRLAPASHGAAPAERAVPRLGSPLARCEVRIAGLGGHGVKLAGTVLSEAAGLNEGRYATQRGEYGSATRGGPSMVDVVLGSEPITYPSADHPDVMVALTERSARQYAQAIRPGGRMIVDPDEVPSPPPGALAVPITALAREHTGKPIAAGMVAVGCVAALTGAVSLDSLRERIAEHVPASAAARNIAACEAGYHAALAALEGASHHG